jgi:stage III sporulation protein AG
MMLLAALGIALILAGSFLRGSPAQPEAKMVPADSGTSGDPSPESVGAYQYELRRRLQEILSCIRGAGRVNVEITFDGGMAREYATNTVVEERKTEEGGTGGTVRKSIETRRTSDLVLAAGSVSGRGESPVIVKEGFPRILGVLVVAEGASDSKVKRELATAAGTALGLPLHRVLVVPLGR